MSTKERLFKMEFYVPESHLDEVKAALFAAGAGRQGDYDMCCWQTQGQGQFRPLEGSQPHIGERGKLETVAEYKVELICQESCILEAVQALRRAHPYEEPAFSVLESLPV